MLLALALACSTPAPPPPAAPPPAHEAAPHTHTAAHGGVVQTLGEVHVEAVMMPEGVMFYLSDADQRPLPLDGWSGTAAVKGPSGVKTVDLMSMGDHLHAPVDLVQGQPASAVLTLIHGGAAQSASFDTPAVGLQSHDHTALHGGKVAMYGNYHLEYLAADGRYEVWVTDEHRGAIRSGVSGVVHDGDVAIPLAFDADVGMLSAAAADAGARPVAVEVTVEKDTFSLPFPAALPAGSPSR